MREKLWALLVTFANLLVVVTMITVITAIITLLPRILISRLLAEGEELTLTILANSEDARRHPKDFPADTVYSQQTIF